MQIRDAVQADFEQITGIYNEVLTNSTAIYNDRPATVEDRIAWWRTRLEQHFPVLAAIEGEHVCGFGSYGDFRSWPGYRYTVEGTVHIASGVRGQGVGSLLLNALIAHAQQAGKHTMIAGVDSENTASLHFLERFGSSASATFARSATSLTDSSTSSFCNTGLRRELHSVKNLLTHGQELRWQNSLGGITLWRNHAIDN